MSCRCPALFHLAPIIQSQAKLPSASPLASRTFFLRADFFSWSCCKESRICLVLYSCTSRLGCLGWSRSPGQVQDSKEFHDGMPSTDNASPRERLDSHDLLDSPSLWQDSPSRSGAASMWQTSTCGFAMQWHPVIKSTSDIMSLTSSRGWAFFLAKRATENEHAIRFSSIQLEDNLAFVQIDYSIIELGLSFWAVSKLVDSKQTWSYPPSQSLPWRSLIITSLAQKRTRISNMVTNWNSWIEPCQLWTLRNGPSDLLGSLLM